MRVKKVKPVQNIRDISVEVQEKILIIHDRLNDELGFKISLNGTLNHILSEGCNYLITNKI